MYALVEILGKQYKAEQGKILKVDKLDKKEGENVEFDTVLLLNKDGKVNIGTPYLKGACVKATVAGQTRGDKVIVFKFKRRKDSKTKKGHRQNYSRVKIERIIK